MSIIHYITQERQSINCRVQHLWHRNLNLNLTMYKTIIMKMILSFYQCYHILIAAKKGAKCRQYYIWTQKILSCEDPFV
jgi:hypothetical protein